MQVDWELILSIASALLSLLSLLIVGRTLWFLRQDERRMKKEIEDLRKRNQVLKYTSVDTRLPQSYRMVSVYDGEALRNAFQQPDGIWIDPHGYVVKGVTHWAEIEKSN